MLLSNWLALGLFVRTRLVKVLSMHFRGFFGVFLLNCRLDDNFSFSILFDSKFVSVICFSAALEN